MKKEGKRDLNERKQEWCLLVEDTKAELSFGGPDIRREKRRHLISGCVTPREKRRKKKGKSMYL